MTWGNTLCLPYPEIWVFGEKKKYPKQPEILCNLFNHLCYLKNCIFPSVIVMGLWLFTAFTSNLTSRHALIDRTFSEGLYIAWSSVLRPIFLCFDCWLEVVAFEVQKEKSERNSGERRNDVPQKWKWGWVSQGHSGWLPTLLHMWSHLY